MTGETNAFLTFLENRQRRCRNDKVRADRVLLSPKADTCTLLTLPSRGGWLPAPVRFVQIRRVL